MAAVPSTFVKRLDRAVLLIALVASKLAFHVLLNTRYGFHRDDLATLADARHLDWGYVAYPPLTPFVGRIALTLFGPPYWRHRRVRDSTHWAAWLVAIPVCYQTKS